LTFDYYAKLFKTGKWPSLFRELDAYCNNFQTGKSVMLPFIAKRALRLENRPKQEEMPSLISASFAQRMKIDERLANYYADLQSTAKKDLTAYRKKYYEQLYTWNKSGVVGTKLSLRYS